MLGIGFGMEEYGRSLRGAANGTYTYLSQYRLSIELMSDADGVREESHFIRSGDPGVEISGRSLSEFSKTLSERKIW